MQEEDSIAQGQRQHSSRTLFIRAKKLTRSDMSNSRRNQIWKHSVCALWRCRGEQERCEHEHTEETHDGASIRVDPERHDEAV